MTREQEQAIEALSLRDGGFASEQPARLVQTREGFYAVDGYGDVHGPARPLKTGFRRLMREVYGAGTTA